MAQFPTDAEALGSQFSNPQAFDSANMMEVYPTLLEFIESNPTPLLFERRPCSSSQESPNLSRLREEEIDPNFLMLGWNTEAFSTGRNAGPSSSIIATGASSPADLPVKRDSQENHTFLEFIESNPTARLFQRRPSSSSQESPNLSRLRQEEEIGPNFLMLGWNAEAFSCGRNAGPSSSIIATGASSPANPNARRSKKRKDSAREKGRARMAE